MPKDILTRAQRPEVLGGLGHDVRVELEGDPAKGAAVGSDVEEALRKRKIISSKPLVSMDLNIGKSRTSTHKRI